jgi:hypothetical protein
MNKGVQLSQEWDRDSGIVGVGEWEWDSESRTVRVGEWDSGSGTTNERSSGKRTEGFAVLQR